jgi:hypothetical protein
MGTFTEGEPEVLTGVSWISETPEVATVSTSGLVTPVSPGTTTLTVTKGNIDATAEITVTAATLVSIALTPDAPSTPLGQTIQIIATGTYTDGEMRPMTDVSWTTETASVATVSSSGLVTPVAEGTTTVTATRWNGYAVDIELTVTPAELVDIEVGGARELKVGEYINGFSVTGVYTDGTRESLNGRPIRYLSSRPDLAEFRYGSNNGALYAKRPGDTEITISTDWSSVSASFLFTVTP